MPEWTPVAQGDTSDMPDIPLEPNTAYRLTISFAIPDWAIEQATEWARVFGIGLAVENDTTILTFLT